MFNLRDKFVKVEREIHMAEGDVMFVLKCIDEIARDAKFWFLKRMDMEIGTHGEYMDSMRWFVNCNLTENQWHVFLALLKDCKRKIIIGETGRYYLS